jgi:hypothetical protein
MKEKNKTSLLENAGDDTMEAARGFCTSPCNLQIAMDKESFTRSPMLKEHFMDERFFSSVPACVFTAFSGLLIVFAAIVIAFFIS